MSLLLLAVGVLLASGVASLAAFRAPRLAVAVGAAGAVAGCLVGLVPALRALHGAVVCDVRHPWAVPVGALVAGLDPLSAFFLVPLLVLSALAAVYGREYLLAYAPRKSLAPPAFFYNLLIASLVGVVTARDGVLFLVAWELMTLASYMLIAFEHEVAAARRAGWTYLIAAHIGVLCLFAMFLLLAPPSGRLEFAALGARGAITATVVFVLALVGFGLKAGLVPLHVWLPEAHAAAPSQVSALMSGVVIKMGLYGLLRTTTFLPPARWWGPTLMTLGVIGALVGVALALYQRDLKRALAYSSVENIGLIVLGLGVGLWGASRGQSRLAALGMAAGMLHLWNHVLMKGLMFLCAGSVLHGAGTKDLERLGGLMKRMPRTGTLMVVGATALSGLPPLNAFAGEWLLYLGLIDGGISVRGAGVAALFAVGLVALVGGLSVLCFVRLIGIALLGEPRSRSAAGAHEPSPWMTGPIVVLALGCVAVAIVPARLLHVLSPVVAEVAGATTAAALDQVAGSAQAIGAAAAALWASLFAVGLIAVALTRRRVDDQTWGCGYAAPTTRMQYTAGSFSETMADRLLPARLRARPSIVSPNEVLPLAGSFGSDSADPFTRGLYEPFLARWANRFARLRWLQQGMLHLYLLYILLVLLLGLGWMSVRAWMGA